MLTLTSLTDQRLAEVLNQGGTAVIPTDTVYGLAASASSREAVRRLYALKLREQKPGTVIASSIDQLVDLGLKRRYLTAVEHFWPGAISVVIPSGPSLEYLDLGKQTLAVRITNDQPLLQLLRQTGPLLTSSANPPGKTPAENIDKAQAYFGTAVDAYADGGDLSERSHSTVIRIVDDAIEILRPGAVKINETGEVYQ